MRILTLDYECNVPGSNVALKGGTERFARDFRKHALAAGHSWIGVLQRREEGGPALEIITDEGDVRLMTVRSKHKGLEDIAKLGSLDELIAATEEDRADLGVVMRGEQPDVVFLNGFSQYSWMLYRAARDAGIPVAFQHAGIFVRDMEAYAAIHPASYFSLARAMERDATEGAAANIFLNAHSRRALEESVAPESVPGSVIIPLPHAGWEFAPARMPGAHAERRIGIVARWDRIKNHEAVLAFAEEACRRNLPWTFVSVTKIPDTAKRAAFKAAYREHIGVLPHMPREELRAFYRTLDAALLPSRFETAGGTVMEAVAEGVPTLISQNVGWVDEYQAHGMQGWIADFTDPASAVSVLERHFARSSWPELASFAAYVAREHDPARVFDAYLSLFRTLDVPATV